MIQTCNSTMKESSREIRETETILSSMCAMPHAMIWYDLFIHVTFLFTLVTVLWMRHRGKSESDQWLFHLCVPCLIQWFDTTYSYTWHYYSCTWHYYSCTWHYYSCTWHYYSCIWQYCDRVIEGNQRKRNDSFIYMRHASFNNVIRLIHKCDITIQTCNSTMKESSREIRETETILSSMCAMPHAMIW